MTDAVRRMLMGLAKEEFQKKIEERKKRDEELEREVEMMKRKMKQKEKENK